MWRHYTWDYVDERRGICFDWYLLFRGPLQFFMVHIYSNWCRHNMEMLLPAFCAWWCHQMETFRCYWPFVRGITGDTELWLFLWSAPEQTGEQTIETPRRYRAHYDVIVMVRNTSVIGWFPHKEQVRRASIFFVNVLNNLLKSRRVVNFRCHYTHVIRWHLFEGNFTEFFLDITNSNVFENYIFQTTVRSHRG